MARTAGSHGIKTKALICENAFIIAGHVGFEALTMRDLARACGIQVAAIYYYFPDKQSLLMSLLSDHFDQLHQITAQCAPDDTARDRLIAFAQNHVVFHATHRAQALLASQELRSLSKANASLILPRRQSYERQLRQILRDGLRDQSFMITDIALTSLAILAMLTEVSVWVRPDAQTSLVQTAHHYALLALKIVVAKPA